MKITNTESLRAAQIAPISSTAGVDAKTPYTGSPSLSNPTPAAVVSLSTHAQAIAVAAVAVDAAPDTREGLVAQLKAQVDAGTYKVSAADIADQMIRRAQADQLR